MPHVCERPLGGAARASMRPWTPRPTEHTAPTVACDKSPNRTYPTVASEAWIAVTMVMTSMNQLERFVAMGNYQTWTENLMGEHVVPVIFWPTGDRWFAGHDGQWQTKALQAHKCPEPHGDIAGTRCSKYHTHNGQLLVTCPVDMWVPLIYNGNLMNARNVALPTFCGRGMFNGEYVVANKWFTYPMFLEPILSFFDFWAKFDVDVCFRRKVNVVDVLQPLVQQKANFFHAKLIVDNVVCELTLGDMLQLYYKTYPCSGWRGKGATFDEEPPWAPWDEPYNHPPVSYGNFIGGWLGFWQSPRLLHFARRWWEWKGGWMHRWGDQQYWMPALWMMDANDSTSVLDLHHLRYSLFRHSKDYYPCGMPDGYQAQANASLQLFASWRQAMSAAAKKREGAAGEAR